MPLLSIIVFLPAVGAIALLLVSNGGGRRDPFMRWAALAVSLAEFAATLFLWARFDPSRGDFQFVEQRSWIGAFGIEYHLGVDGISLFLVILTAFLTPLALLSSWGSVRRQVKAFSALMLLLESAMLGVFVSLDLFLFYVFWDAMLVPMYLLIGIWGYDRRVYAAVKFILFTMAGSVLMLIAIIGLSYWHSAATGAYSFDLLKLYELKLPHH